MCTASHSSPRKPGATNQIQDFYSIAEQFLQLSMTFFCNYCILWEWLTIHMVTKPLFSPSLPSWGVWHVRLGHCYARSLPWSAYSGFFCIGCFTEGLGAREAEGLGPGLNSPWSSSIYEGNKNVWPQAMNNPEGYSFGGVGLTGHSAYSTPLQPQWHV